MDERLAHILWAWGRDWLARLATGDVRATGVTVGYTQDGEGRHDLVIVFPTSGVPLRIVLPVTDEFFYSHALPLIGGTYLPLPPDIEQQHLTYWGTVIQTLYPLAVTDPEKGIAHVLGITDDALPTL